jgi:hypothetical protein
LTECSKLLDQGKQAKLQWLQDLRQINGDNLNSIRCEASTHFRTTKKREYLRDKINELAMKSKNKNIRDLYRGINEFKRGYKLRNNLHELMHKGWAIIIWPLHCNLVKGENGDLRADSYNILNRRKNYFSQLLNVHRVSDVRQIEIHTAEPLVPDPGPFEVEMTTLMLKRYKSPGSDQILAELIQAEGKTLWSEIHKLIISIWNCLISGRSLL